MKLFTDASGTHGWGAYWDGRWIQGQWPMEHLHKTITWKGLYAIAAAVNTWGHQWECIKVLFCCDNEFVRTIWHKGSTKQPEAMALVRMLYFGAACFNIHALITHIAGTRNDIADAISSSQMRRFRHLATQVAPLRDPIPAWSTQFWTRCSFSTSP